MTWTAQANSSAVAPAAPGDVKYAYDNRVAGLACTHSEVLSQRAAIKVDTKGVPLPGAQSPSRLGLPSLGMGPWYRHSFLIFLK